MGNKNKPKSILETINKHTETLDKQPKLKIGKYEVCFYDGSEKNGIWIQDTKTGEGSQFSCRKLEIAIEMMLKYL